MSPYYYHLKFELYPTPNPTASGNETDRAVGEPALDRNLHEELWVPSPGASIFDDLPSHPRRSGYRAVFQAASGDRAEENRPDTHQVVSVSPGYYANSRVIDCGAHRGKTYDAEGDAEADPFAATAAAPDDDGGGRRRYGARLSERQYRARAERSPPPRVADGIGPDTAVRDWRFGRINIESFDLGFGAAAKGEEKKKQDKNRPVSMATSTGGGGIPIAATPAASLGPNLGGVGLATKARYLPLETKNTEAGWGIVHLYREGDEPGGLKELEDVAGEGNSGDGEDGTILCIPAVPSYMSPSDFLGFVGEKWRGDVSHYRMVMTSRMSRYMVLMKFRDRTRAREWKKEFDGKPFDSVETEICHVTFIKSITVETPNQRSTQRRQSETNGDRFSAASSSVVSSLKPFPPPTPNLIELPTCAVCLERMDDTTGLMTILCQHVFHCTCLQTWKGSGCPVCRATNPKPYQDGYDPDNPYSQPFGSGVANICNNCNCTDDLWICLICGNVGCGRYNGGHAKEHWKLTAHSFSLELETQHVWDYAGDMWVHRLIRDKGDGKIVELPRNNNPNTNPNHNNERPPGPQEDVVPRAKLDSIGMEYTHLLTSQLESQRVYFEEMVSKAADKAAKATAAAESASVQAAEALGQLAALREEHRALRDETVPSLERELAREKGRAAKSAELARSLGKALQEEKEVSAGLMKRIEHLQGEAEASGRLLETLRAENEELKEMNRDLTMFISGQEKLKEMEKEGVVEQGELEDGTVGVPEGSTGGGSRRQKGKGKGKGRR